ncbi:MAG: oligosaccharide flippase family protein [Gaiellales bacterium]
MAADGGAGTGLSRAPGGDGRVLRADGQPLRVTFCPVNTAGVPWTTAEALRRRGVDSRLVVFNRYALHPEADRSLDLEGGLLRRQGRQWRELRRLLPETDVFHFVFGLTLVPQSLQFPILRAFGKRSVFHYLGSDIRGKTPEQLKFGKKADGEIVGSYDAIRWVPEATVIPPGIDVRSIVPSPPARHERPVVVHAPSSRERKGTARVIEACAGLDVDLQIVEGLHHAEAFERYRNADIIVDQLHAGWYGLFAIECMALGKPVVTFLHDEAVRRTEEAYEIPVPIVNASPDDLRRQLEELVALGPEGRATLGARSRTYVERVHDLERVTDRLLDLYAAAMEPERARRRQAVEAVAKRAPLAPREPEPYDLDEPDLETGMPTAVTPPPRPDAVGGLGGQLKRLGRHSVIYGIGGVVSRAIAIVLLPLYTHYLSPDDNGKVEMLTALTTVLGLLFRAGITSAFFRFYFDAVDHAGRLRVLRTSFWFNMIAATAGLALLSGAAGPISQTLFGSPDAANLVRASGVALWATVNYEQLTALFRVEERSVAFVIASLVNIFLTIGTTLLLVVALEKGPIGVIVGNFTGTLVVYLALLGFRRDQLGLQFDRPLLRQMNAFGLPLVPTGLFLWITNFSDRFFLGKLSSVAEAGLYSVGVKVASAMVLVLTAFRTAWPAFAYSIRDEREARRTYAYVLTYLTVVATWVSLALTLLAPTIGRLFDPAYHRSASVVGPLAFSSVSYGAYIVVAIGIGRSRRTQFNWVVTLIAAVVNISLNLILIPRYGMMGAAVSTVAAYTAMAMAMAWWSQRIYPVPYQWRRVATAAGVGVLLAVCGKLLHAGPALQVGLTLAYPLALVLAGFTTRGERQAFRAAARRLAGAGG